MKNDTLSIRLPIQKGLLNIIIDRVNEYYLSKGQEYLAKLYTAIIATGYFGLMRVGELTMGSHPVKAPDFMIARSKFKIQIVLRSSKTHSLANEPQKITIIRTHRTHDPHCTYSIIKQFLDIRGGYFSDEEPFFIFRDRSPVKPYHLRTVLHRPIQIYWSRPHPL